MATNEEQTEGFRGEELYIYPPDTYLKPILILSRTCGEVAIAWGDGLNHFHIIQEGLKKTATDFKILSTGEDTSLFETLRDQLKGGDGDNGWTTYLRLWKEHCGKERVK